MWLLHQVWDAISGPGSVVKELTMLQALAKCCAALGKHQLIGCTTSIKQYVLYLCTLHYKLSFHREHIWHTLHCTLTETLPIATKHM